METPFEGTETVAGGVWNLPKLLGKPVETGLIKLRFSAGTGDLPLHAHLHSDRFIMVLAGRGFYHVTDEPVDTFTGTRVRSVPVRSRDALVFSRGVVHTFSAPTEPLVLLSFHEPFIPLDEPGQYTLPGTVLRPRDLVPGLAQVALDPAWNVLAG